MELQAPTTQHTLYRLQDFQVNKAIASAENRLSIPGGALQRRNVGETQIFQHVLFVPGGPPTRQFHHLFRDHVVEPDSESRFAPCPLDELKNQHGRKMRRPRLTVAYHRLPNLGNCLSPRRVRHVPGQEVSTIFANLDQDRFGRFKTVPPELNPT